MRKTVTYFATCEITINFAVILLWPFFSRLTYESFSLKELALAQQESFHFFCGRENCNLSYKAESSLRRSQLHLRKKLKQLHIIR